VANQSVINRKSKVADVPIDTGIPCKDKSPIVLASVVPNPPGINVSAPIKEEVVWAKIELSQLIDRLKPFKMIKKLEPSITQANNPSIVEIVIFFGDISILITSKFLLVNFIFLFGNILPSITIK
tara:strand:+ start:111 stop:485 length:375 start_codon:yes stop_codon:yes gene_type:complete